MIHDWGNYVRRERVSFGRMTKHGMYKTELYKRWAKMMARCTNPKQDSYCRYGGRGIKICHEWVDDFINFRDWAMNNGYQEGLSLDRIDVNGNYEPANCRWITFKEQYFNKRSNIGLEKAILIRSLYPAMNCNQIAKKVGVSWGTAKKVINNEIY